MATAMHTELDAAWFRAHPYRRFRLRRATKAENLEVFHRGVIRVRVEAYVIVSRDGRACTFVVSLETRPQDNDAALEQLFLTKAGPLSEGLS